MIPEGEFSITTKVIDGNTVITIVYSAPVEQNDWLETILLAGIASTSVTHPDMPKELLIEFFETIIDDYKMLKPKWVPHN